MCFHWNSFHRHFSGGRNGHNKRRHHGHKQHNGANSAIASLESQGKLGAPDLQGTDANTPTASPPTAHRRGPRRHSGGKGFVWKQVGFSECSKTCGGGNNNLNVNIQLETNVIKTKLCLQVFNRHWSFVSGSIIKFQWPITAVETKIVYLQRQFDAIPNRVQLSKWIVSVVTRDLSSLSSFFLLLLLFLSRKMR